MRRFKKSSTAVFTILALALMPVLPAAAQTMQSAQTVKAAQKDRTACDTRTVHTVQTGSDAEGGSITVTVVDKKTAADNGDVIITWIEDPQTEAAVEQGAEDNRSTEYKVKAVRMKEASVE